MTREQLDMANSAIDYVWRAVRSTEIRELCAMARRALELEEALEWFAKQGDSELDEFQGEYRAKCWVGTCENYTYGVGATPLEAIQNARRAYAK